MNAVRAYHMAEVLHRPLVATASQQDWAFINAHKAEHLVCVWIALAYACGQRFMVPNKILCSVYGGAVQWFCGTSSVFIPLYQFIRDHAALLNDCAAFGPLEVLELSPKSYLNYEDRKTLEAMLTSEMIHPLTANGKTWLFPRIKNDGTMSIHIINLAYNVQTNSQTAQKNVEIRLPNSLLKRQYNEVTLYGYGQIKQKLEVTQDGDSSVFYIPELLLWSIATFEYWA
jgi:hypothetical protein